MKKKHVYTKKMPIKINLVGRSFSCQINDRRCTTSKTEVLIQVSTVDGSEIPFPTTDLEWFFKSCRKSWDFNYQPPLHWLARFRFLNHQQ